MPVIKITRKTVGEIQPVDKPTIFYDADLKGFGLKVMPTGARSWIAEYRAGVSGRGTPKSRVVIGAYRLFTPEEARGKAKDILASARVGDDPAALRAKERASMTVSELMDAFLKEHVKTKRKGSTAGLYAGIIEKHVRPALGSTKVGRLTRAEVAKLHLSMRDLPYQANRVLAIIGAAYTFADRNGIVDEGYNPARKVERYREHSRERYLTTAEVERLGEVLRQAETDGLPWTPSHKKHAPKRAEVTRTILGPHLTGAIRLLMLTGCRLREILHLRWQDIDTDRGLLFLPDSKTGKKTVVLSTAASTVLETMPRIGIYVVASESAGIADEKPRADLKRPWALVSQHAGLAGVRLHDLRHSFASVGAGAGMGLPVIGKLLGHSQAQTTARYAHLDVDPTRIAANTIAGKIEKALGGR